MMPFWPQRTDLVFVPLFSFVLLTGLVPRSCEAQALPTNLRVDIADGNTGELIITWTEPTGSPAPTYYTLQRWTSSNPTPVTVVNCSGTTNFVTTGTPFNEGGGSTNVCRDNNGGAGLTVGTSYFYQVESCIAGNSPPCPAGFTTSAPSNTPLTCNCTQGSTSSQIPPMIYGTAEQSLRPPDPIRLVTSVVTPDASYQPGTHEIAAYHNPGPSGYSITPKNVLFVELPGSGGACEYSPLMYTAQNLGFDGICVNYSNNTEQEIICLGDPGCFYYISEAKFNGTGPCNNPNLSNPTYCGSDPYYGGGTYWNEFPDSVPHRVITMLQYLIKNQSMYQGADWGQYLTPGNLPNWGQIMVGGFSQGGDMATYTAGFEAAQGTPILRAINLSAPPQAVEINGTYTAATYFQGPPLWLPAPTIRSVFGLVSANDPHYTPPTNPNGVYQTVWVAMGFTAANHDSEYDLNQVGSPQGLSCSGTPSNNLVNFAAVNPYPGHDGHVDPNYIWNQDMFEFMLLDN